MRLDPTVERRQRHARRERLRHPLDQGPVRQTRSRRLRGLDHGAKLRPFHCHERAPGTGQRLPGLHLHGRVGPRLVGELVDLVRRQLQEPIRDLR